MKYVLFNMNSLQGFQKGHFNDLRNLYFVSTKDVAYSYGKSIEAFWSPNILAAHKFNSEQEAWDLANQVWYENFTHTTFSVMSVHEDYFINQQDRMEFANES
jgi:hypothetical protein